MSPTMITHLLVTTRFVAKGGIRTDRRLQDLLGEGGPGHLILEGATLWELDGPRKLELGTAMIRRDQCVLGHEYVDLRSDPYRSQLEASEPRQRASLLLSDPQGWEVEGELRAAEIGPARVDGVMVLHAPRFGSTPTSGAAQEVLPALHSLPYLLVQRPHVHGFIAHE